MFKLKPHIGVTGFTSQHQIDTIKFPQSIPGYVISVGVYCCTSTLTRGGVGNYRFPSRKQFEGCLKYVAKLPAHVHSVAHYTFRNPCPKILEADIQTIAEMEPAVLQLNTDSPKALRHAVHTATACRVTPQIRFGIGIGFLQHWGMHLGKASQLLSASAPLDNIAPVQLYLGDPINYEAVSVAGQVVNSFWNLSFGVTSGSVGMCSISKTMHTLGPRISIDAEMGLRDLTTGPLNTSRVQTFLNAAANTASSLNV